MKCNICEISGVWIGRFQSDDGTAECVPFSAWLTTHQGRLSGSTLEPAHALIDHPGDELDAVLSGHVDDQEVVFLKTYQGVELEPVYCEGDVVDHGTRIVGRWYFGWPNERTGTFEMSRDSVARAGKPSTSAKIGS